MIYMDNSATTMEKPPQVAVAMAEALSTVGNPGRSFHDGALTAARCVYNARRQVASLASMGNPLQVAFTSGATESLNLVFQSLLKPGDHVITTVLEHNSVLRPLYRLGCQLSFIPCDEQGVLRLDLLPALLQDNTRAMVITHGSNILGNITEATVVKDFCLTHHLTLIWDISQTFGSIPVTADMGDILCFTGHKSLMGPQGTGGIIAQPHVNFPLVKTGGSGSRSFDHHQALTMPDVMEAGTPNTHGLAGLQASVAYLNQLGIDQIVHHERTLCQQFLQGIASIPGIRHYGDPSPNRLPVIALNVKEYGADAVSEALWERHQIATRPGSHCAPLVHRHFGTEGQGMVRFSLGLYNTAQEVDVALDALETLAKRGLPL